MLEVSDKQTGSYFQIHYYFEDRHDHSMDAFIRNKAEKELLEIIKSFTEIIGIKVNLETEAYSEGGLKERIKWLFITASVSAVFVLSEELIKAFIIPMFNGDNDLKSKQIQSIELDIVLKKLEIEKKKLELKEGKETTIQSGSNESKNNEIERKKIIRHISNYYQILQSYEKITEVSYTNVINNQTIFDEQAISRDIFGNFIFAELKEEKVDENALIEIISPVLNEKTYKWKGLYKGEAIDFSMGDTKFKTEVAEGKYKFSNGSYIMCILQINSKYDEFETNIHNTYSVKSVLEVSDSIAFKRITLKGMKKIKEQKHARDTQIPNLLTYQVNT